jgi:NAD(P)-dependent dehydrogenase (short-subunit alcohol dehydrogenase family)
MSGWLEGKVVLITGGAGGMAGLSSSVTSRKGYALPSSTIEGETPRAQGSLGRQRGYIRRGRTQLSRQRRSRRRVCPRIGRLNVFVGNAAVFDCFLSLDDLPEKAIDDAFREIFDTNVKGYLFGC